MIKISLDNKAKSFHRLPIWREQERLCCPLGLEMRFGTT